MHRSPSLPLCLLHAITNASWQQLLLRKAEVSMADITVESVHLTKKYRERTAIEDVSFTARSGDVVGLLGPNGAGKTTTIRLLTSVLIPTSGEFRIAGRPWTSPAEIRRRVGVLPESSGYPGFQTGREYLGYHARLYGFSNRRARNVADSLLTEVGLDERAGSRISSYSRGMRQRLGIARALVNDPIVVFLDEPNLGLDPAGQSQVLQIMRHVAQVRGATVILSTHTLSEVEEVCSQVLILNQGRLVAWGSVGDVMRTAEVERFAQLRVPTNLMERARQAIEELPEFTIEATDGRPDLLRIALRTSSSRSSAESSERLNAAVIAVAAANVPVLSYEIEGARLSDAFLQMTRKAVS
jgi:ABC-2 type transport system ATP-binding protein